MDTKTRGQRSKSWPLVFVLILSVLTVNFPKFGPTVYTVCVDTVCVYIFGYTGVHKLLCIGTQFGALDFSIQWEVPLWPVVVGGATTFYACLFCASLLPGYVLSVGL